MATFDFNISAADLVTSAIRSFGGIEEEETLNASQLQDGIQAANLLIKTWQKQGAHLWRQTEGVLFLNVGQFRYELGPSGDRTAEELDFVETSMAGAQTSGNTIIDVVATAGMAAADEIGIFVNTANRFWTTIVSVDSDTQLTITDALPSDINDNATVFTFTERIQRPLRILHGRRRAGGPSVGEIPTFPLSHNYYFDLTTRSTATGLPVEHYYKPLLNEGALFLWPVPSSVDFLFKFTFSKPLADIDTNSDLTDFPQEWLDPLKWNIARKLMTDYRVVAQERQFILTEASQTLEGALDFDRENAPLRFIPELRGFG